MATTTNDLHNSNTHALKTARTHHQQSHECRACVSHARQRMKTETYIAKASIKPYTQTYLQRTHQNIDRIQWQRWQLSYRHAHSSHTLSLTLSVCFSFILLWLIAVALLYSAIFKRFVQQLFSSVKFCCLTNQINIFLIINWILFKFFAKQKISARNSSKFHKSIVEPVTRQEFISTS